MKGALHFESPGGFGFTNVVMVQFLLPCCSGGQINEKLGGYRDRLVGTDTSVCGAVLELLDGHNLMDRVLHFEWEWIGKLYRLQRMQRKR